MNSINVFYRNIKVGELAISEKKYYFQYDEKWLKNGFSISPFSLPLENKLFTPKNTIFDGLFGVFSDSLPDSWGKLIFDRFIKKNNLDKNINCIDRLSYIGSSGMGALEYIPSKANINETEIISLEKYQKEANLILNEKSNYDINYLYKFGGSSGGARPKALIKIGNDSYIVKFQSKYDIKNSGVMEYEYALCAKECNINIMEVKLLEDKFFVIKRFDRINNSKIHMITATALLEADFRSPCLDYNDLFKLVRIVTNESSEDIIELYRRMCFNVFSHNYDDHAKNFCFVYDEDIRRYRLSPAYDLTYSNTYYNEHTTSINGKGNNILDSDLIDVAIKAGINEKKAMIILQDIKKIVSNKLKKYL